ncbi:glycosyltransferase [Alkalilimnicola ehrlichii]|uniref:glycosyltransferase n=1 Tax=Alkalilimnicola ehrlichii TaxID=351052 RepID=UPI00067481C0
MGCLQRGPAAAAQAADASAQPLVSVIMPAFNAASYIEEAIDSVLAQDYPHKELIVIDDGSSDDTVARVQAYGDRVRLLTQANQGSAVARNQGLDAAQGEYIAFLDSDDVWLPGKLTAQVGYLEAHPDVGMIYSDWLPWKRDKQSKAFPPPEALAPATPDTGVPPEEIPLLTEGSGWLYNRLLFGSLLHTITVMARRELIEQVGRFDPELKRGQDYDYWLRASRHTEIHQLDRVFALYRLHGSGCITQWPDINYEKLVVEKALARWGLEGPTGERSDRKAVERRLAGTCFDFGYHHYWSGNPRRASRSFLEALRHHPRHLGSWRYAGMSLAMGLFKGR